MKISNKQQELFDTFKSGKYKVFDLGGGAGVGSPVPGGDGADGVCYVFY